MLTNNTIKEYYIKIQSLYYNVVNMLNAINQSLSTTSSEVTVSLNNENGEETLLRLPSFLYLENKVEQLSLNLNNLINMPESGEAWFENNKGMYKLQMIKSKTAPLTPILAEDYKISFKDNNILRDMVSPKTYLRIKIDNIPDNIEKMFMKKYIIFDDNTFSNELIQNAETYNDFKSALFNFTKGREYDVYDSIIDLPIKEDEYESNFRILEIPELEDGDNPWIENDNNPHKHYRYKIILDNIEYVNSEDSSIRYTLKKGDYLSLGNEYTIYKIINIETKTNTVYIEEVVGHIVLQEYQYNSEMIFQIYNINYDKYHYVDIPLEENQYLCIFLGTIHNNTRSILSKPILIDLSQIYITNENGDYILDEFGEKMSYMTYYNKFCSNIGDLILGLSQTCYPQISNFSPENLKELQESKVIKDLVSTTLNVDGILKVVPINKHLIDDVTTEEIINLHTQKAEINSQLSTVEDNISQVSNQLLTTDFSQEVKITQVSLQSKLTNYYTERLSLQKQLISIIDNINSKNADKTLTLSTTKYRVRGVSDYKGLENYLKTEFGDKCEIIGLDVEYKYKSDTTDTTTLTTINSSTFTDWNRLNNIDKQRYLVFNSEVSAFNVKYVNYESTDNIIKWNQVDIPIKQGEDVILRYRYKYSIGQPFINLYTPWSDEYTVPFPVEFEENSDLINIIEKNKEDTISAKFNSTLINEGYQEHINNKLISGDQSFYHMPENIYSGFNTPENSLISLKDKLLSMVNDIEKYKDLIENEVNSKFEVYLSFDNKTIEINNNTNNKISIYNNDHISNSFVRKEMNIIIKNTGDRRVNLYSIFPGNIDTALITKEEYYNKQIINYERVPITVGGNIKAQVMGQWIYFRQNNLFSGKDYYFNNRKQNRKDVGNINSDKLIFEDLYSKYISVDNCQVLLGFRKREENTIYNFMTFWNGLTLNENREYEFINNNNNDIDNVEKLDYTNKDENFFIYSNYKDINSLNNNYITKYEDFVGRSKMIKNDTSETVYLDAETSIQDFLNNYDVPGVTDSSNLTGAFLYPNFESISEILTNGNERDAKIIEVGESVSVPLIFEYYIDNKDSSEDTKITKTISFDIRNSLIKEPLNYVIEITANSDLSVSGNVYNSTLSDLISETD